MIIYYGVTEWLVGHCILRTVFYDLWSISQISQVERWLYIEWQHFFTWSLWMTSRPFVRRAIGVQFGCRCDLWILRRCMVYKSAAGCVDPGVVTWFSFGQQSTRSPWKNTMRLSMLQRPGPQQKQECTWCEKNISTRTKSEDGTESHLRYPLRRSPKTASGMVGFTWGPNVPTWLPDPRDSYSDSAMALWTSCTKKRGIFTGAMGIPDDANPLNRCLPAEVVTRTGWET